MSLFSGTPAPFFAAPTPSNPHYVFSSLGGRWILLAFLPGPGPERDAALRLLHDNRPAFETNDIVAFAVLADEASFRQASDGKRLRFFGDWKGDIRRLYDAAGPDGEVIPQWVVVDPSMRIMGTAPLESGRTVLSTLIAEGRPDDHAGVPLHAPVLIAPRIFEPELCRELIARYDARGGEPSGVMRERDGMTVGVLDDFKKRRDHWLDDAELIGRIRQRLTLRLFPQIEKCFRFRPTWVERYIVACYDAEEGGYFRPHRDDGAAGTAHRRFAVTINLNADGFEGGDLKFPEFGSRTYRAPTGGAVVFSCSLLHEATPVTRGRRYAFLPFLYDDAAAEIREANRRLIQNDPVASPTVEAEAAADART